MDNSPAGIIVVDRDGTICFANRRAEEILGLSRELIAGRHYDDSQWCITDFDGNPLGAPALPVRCAIETGRPVYGRRFAVKHPDGRRVFLSVNASPILSSRGDVCAVITAFEDITELNRAEEDLRLYRRAVQASREMIVAVGRDYRYLFANEAYLQYHGLTAEELLGATAEQILGRQTFHDKLKSQLDQCLSGTVVLFDMTRRHPELGERLLQVSYSPLRDSRREVNGVVAVITDITEREKVKASLADSEAKFRSLSEQSIMGIAIIQVDRVLFINQALADIAGVPLPPPSQATPEGILSWVHPDDRVWVEELLRQKLAGELQNENHHTYRALTPSGETRWVDSYSSQGAIDGVVTVFVNVVDITEQRRALESLKDANRLLGENQAKLEEKNVVLKGILDEIDWERKQFGNQLHSNLNVVVAPLLRMLKSRHGHISGDLIGRLEQALENLASPFVHQLESRYRELAPREIEICHLLKTGLSSKQIAEHLSTSVHTVLKQRKLIRRKLGLKRRNTNLCSFLKSLADKPARRATPCDSWD